MGLEQIEKAIAFVQEQGPVLPVQLVKILGGNTMLSGAVLAQLVSERKIMVSSAKIGGSSVYYVQGQEPKLAMLFQYLNEKDKQTYELLQKQKILRDSEQTTLLRFSLRQLKDFAKPLEVTMGDVQELFWKWYLVSDEEATELIRTYVAMTAPFTEQKNGLQKTEVTHQNNTVSSQMIQENSQKQVAQKEVQQPVLKEIKESVKRREKTQKSMEEKKDAQTHIPLANLEDVKDSFVQEIRAFFRKKEIVVLSFNHIKQNTETDFILSVPTAVGNVQYYCKAKNKQKLLEGDLHSAFSQGQIHKLPVLLISNGEVTKKAKELLEKELKTITYVSLR